MDEKDAFNAELGQEVGHSVQVGELSKETKFQQHDMRMVWRQLKCMVAKMGERPVQESGSKIPANKMQRRVPTIYTLVIGASVRFKYL